MKASAFRFLLTIAISISAALAQNSPESQSARPSPITIVKAGFLIDPATGTSSRNQIIRIELGKITAVGLAVQIPSNASVVDLSAYSVLPGLFDAHTHLCLTTDRQHDGDNFANAIYRESTAYRALEGAANARDMLYAGFTTVRDVGNAGNYADTDLRRAVEAGLVEGPTIINAGRIVAPYGGQVQLQPDRRELGEPEFLYADTHDEMKKAIRENVHFGAKVIKIVVDPYPQPYMYSVEDIRYIVAEAANSGLKVAAHATSDKGARNAAEGDVASIEHGYEMSDETLEIAKRNHVVLVGTDLTETALREMGFPGDLKRWHATIVHRLRQAYEIGVTMAYGSDADYALAESTRSQLSLSLLDSWREAQIPPKVVLQALTINAAQLLGVDKERGTIHPGFAADLIATKGNPLDDIDSLRQVVFVMKDGRIVRRP